MKTKVEALARNLGEGAIWIDHASLSEEDFPWLAGVERLTLWNVQVPAGFLKRLVNLWWIDWRGGGVSQGLDQIRECPNLRYVAVNQVRGLANLDFLTRLQSLEMIKLYGLSKVPQLPSMKGALKMRRAEIGQLKSITSIGPLLEAPNLEELQLHNFVGVNADDVSKMKMHPTLRAFEWYGENIPDKMWVPVRDAVGLPKTRPVYPEEWFGVTPS